MAILRAARLPTAEPWLRNKKARRRFRAGLPQQRDLQNRTAFTGQDS